MSDDDPIAIPPKDAIDRAIAVCGDTMRVDLWYPRNSAIKAIEIDLIDVRAADSIRVTYDFERDGWIIEQASIFEWPNDDPVCDPGWDEVAFVKAWARKAKGGRP